MTNLLPRPLAPGHQLCPLLTSIRWGQGPEIVAPAPRTPLGKGSWVDRDGPRAISLHPLSFYRCRSEN